MKKPKINVIDLDNTLVPFDTFRRFVLREIKKGKWQVLCYAALRLLRIISSSNFKMKVHKYLVKTYQESYFEDYVKEIFQNLDQEVLKIVQSHTDNETTNILLSASPDEYVSEMAHLLKWKGKGSFFSEPGIYCHLYGPEKIKWLRANYPNEKYEYGFAVSDNDSDNSLLLMFSSKMIWR